MTLDDTPEDAGVRSKVPRVGGRPLSSGYKPILSVTGSMTRITDTGPTFLPSAAIGPATAKNPQPIEPFRTIRLFPPAIGVLTGQTLSPSP
jgi:hypothetical protein